MASVRAQPWLALAADNLTSLAELTENSLLKAIEDRYRAGLIYSAVGDILVAVNPFQELAVYDRAWSKAYETADVSGLAPHIYRVAAAAYNSMVQGKKNQVCVISGESGAGKTESAKFIMKQVMDMCRSAGLGLKLQQKIIQLNPLLEAFGNARTELNDNSSRFGKFIQLLFETSGRIVGAGLEQYLLEKSRICVQTERERNFHIFYYLYAGLPSEKKAQLHLKSPSQHRYLQTYRHLNADCTSQDSRVAFSTVLESMESIGFSATEIDQVLTLLAAVLHIGDIEFTCSEERGGDVATIKNPELIETISQLLSLENSNDLSFALTTLRTVTRGEPVDKLYSCSKAAVVRDAAAKALYARMFQWIISRINTQLHPKDKRGRTKNLAQEDYLNIGILDIFGFENFEANSFEQFCINLANEQLQQYFNHQIFAMEKMECAKEGVEDLDITYTDNTPVIQLFLARPIGLLCLLDEQCKGLNGSETAFVQRCRESFNERKSFKPHRGNALEFTVSHYAGDVTYSIDGFIEKNRDSLPDTVADALRLTSLQLLGVLFAPTTPNVATAGSRGDQLRKSFLRKSQRSVMRAMSQRRKRMSMSPKKKQRQLNRKLLTVSAHFRESLELLMERLFAASPHFVRCVKPNLQKQPNLFEPDFVLQQLRYTGMLEAVRVRREGYSYRPFFSDFVNSYRAVAYPFTDEDVKLTEATCQVILTKAGLTGWRLARSRVFLRYFHEQKLQLILKAMDDGAVLIQRIYRGYRARKLFKPLRERYRLQNVQVVQMLSQIATDGQIHQPMLKALDRIDILEAPKRAFNHRPQRDAPAEVGPSSEDYSGLSTQQRKAKKAKKFGVKVGAMGIDDGVLQAALRGQNSPRNSFRPPSEIEVSRPPSGVEVSKPPWFSRTPSDIEVPRPPEMSRTPSDIEVSRPPAVSRTPSDIESPSHCECPPSGPRPPPPQYPPPPSKKPARPPRTSITPSISGDDMSPLSLSPSSSPSHAAYGASGTNLSPRHHQNPPPTSPRRKRPPPRLTDSSQRPSRPINVTTAAQSSNNNTPLRSRNAEVSPVPKPRKSKLPNISMGGPGANIGTPSAVFSGSDTNRQRHLSDSDTYEPMSQNPSRGGRRLVGGVKSLPTSDDSSKRDPDVLYQISPNRAEKSHKTQAEHFNYKNGVVVYPHTPDYGRRGQENVQQQPRRALLAGDDGGESTLDFRRVSSNSSSNDTTTPHLRYISSSVPDLLDDPTSPPSTPEMFVNGQVFSPNAVGSSRGVALSSDNLLEDQRYHNGGDSGPRSSPYSGVGGATHNTAAYNRINSEPPQADKRKAKGWFGFKRLSRKKSGSNESVSSPLTSPVRRESDPQLLGYYPGLSYENAVELVSGQPKGTYLLFKEELEYSGESCVYKLGVSAGREIKMFPILYTKTGREFQFQLVSGTSRAHAPHNTLKSLVEHYKSVALTGGLTLTQPRLVAGVAVTGVNVTRKQPQMARGRLKGRRKH